MSDNIAKNIADNILNQDRITLHTPLPERKDILYLSVGTERYSLGTSGNISTILGKPKVGKSTFLKVLVKDSLKELINRKCSILYIDTEQSASEVKSILDYVKDAYGADITDQYLYTVSFKTKTDDEKIKGISALMDMYGKHFQLVILDGIADFVNSPNDERESNSLVKILMHAASCNENHIVCVLHENKKDGAPRGHLGSELMRKSETVFSLKRSKGGGTDIIPIYERHGVRPCTSMFINDGQPIIKKNNLDLKKGNISKSPLPADFEISKVKALFADACKAAKELTKGQLQQNIREVAAKSNIKFGESKSREWVNYAIDNEIIRKLSNGKLGLN